MFWSKENIQKLSKLFTEKYELFEDWDKFLEQTGCEIIPVESVFEACDLINLRDDLEEFVALGSNECELILVPKDFAATAIVLGELPDVN